ncbi:MAG TPA: HAMP domain-containing protein, partial [Pseudomonadota bacterium]|nr:HAMP domain-containing protein [Pseudomonadota bacterium]
GFRIPIGADPPLGYLIAANRLDRELLQADAEPLGVAVAVAVGELFVTTLPPGLLTTARWEDLVRSTATQKTRHAAGQWAQLHEEYLLRAVPFGSGYLMVAVQQSRVQPFRTALVRLSSVLVLAVLVLTIAVMMGITGRILSPITKLTRAVDLLARGQLSRSRPLLDEFAERADEVGALARAQLLSTSHLQTVVKTSQRLIRHIESNIGVIDEAAAAVATSASRQEERLAEVTETLGPLSRSLVQTSQGLQDAHRILTSLSLSSTAADQMQAILSTAVRRAEALLNYKEKDKDKETAEPRALRTASVLQQAGVISQAVADQREAFQKVRESVGLLRTCLDDALTAPRMDPQSGQQAQRAASEIGRLAKAHGQESAALHAAAEQLRRGIAEMQKQLSCLDTRSSDEVGRAISEERLPGASGTNRPVGDSAALDAPKRRAERARPSPAGGTRRSVGASSSQSLAPVSGISPERKGAAGQTAGSGVGFKPVGRSSGDHPKVSVPHESVPSGSSF